MAKVKAVSTAAATSTAAAGVLGVTTSTVGATTVKARTDFRDSLQALLQGVEAVIPDGSTIPGPSGGFAKAALVTQLEQWLALYSAVDTQTLALKGARLGLTDAIPQAHLLYAAVKAALQGFYGPGNPQLTQFGFTPKKARAKASGQQLAARAVRSAGTREIRGTLGSAERKKAPKFTGVVTAAAAAPTATPVAEPVQTATPAPAAGAASTTTSA